MPRGIFSWLSGRGGNDDNALQSRSFEPERSSYTFNDVAGCEEPKAEMSEIVDALRDPRVFRAMGARLPKGVLLIGPPGNGKTLLARATAGEARVPFFSVSGSEFVEKYVGVGASRVRELFAAARKYNAAIIFIDEIDAVGRRRDGGMDGGHGERDQTLNQILVEMDGFTENEAIILIAATNRPDILDPALTRPGRFDRQVAIDAPEVHGRRAIFVTHMRNKPVAPEVDADLLAQRTPGFSGADIAAVCNEAAILASRRIISSRRKGGTVPANITLADLDEAIDRISMGVARNSRARAMSDADKLNTAYHEAGHAAIAQSMADADPVAKITILPRAKALGYVQSVPETDRFSSTEKQLRARIMMAMGGRISTEFFLGIVDTGPSNDFEQATRIARAMVTKFGMSKRVGVMSIPDDPSALSPELAKLVDSEVQRILNDCAREARKIIRANRERIERVVKELLVKETLLGSEFRTLWGDTTKWQFRCRKSLFSRVWESLSEWYHHRFCDKCPVRQ